jgi:tetratricopeptide (TPR) repeat protein
MQALRIRQEIGDKNGSAASMNNIGLIYRDLGDTDKSIDFFGEALEIYQSSGNQQSAGFVLNNIGDVHSRLGKHELAANQYKKALAIFEKMGDNRGIAITTQNMGQLYSQINRFDEAKKYYNRALTHAQQINDLEIIKNVSYELYNLYDRTGNSAKALENYKLYNNSRDSIDNSQNTRRMLELQSLYEISVKEKDVELQKSKDENKTLKANSQHREMIFIADVAVLVLTLCFIVVSRRKKQREEN